MGIYAGSASSLYFVMDDAVIVGDAEEIWNESNERFSDTYRTRPFNLLN